MSRSYKHTPVYSDYARKTTRYLKRQASHKIRRTLDIPNGKAYRKFYNSWFIHDYTQYWTREDAIDHYNKYKDIYDDQTLENYMHTVWEKYFFRK